MLFFGEGFVFVCGVKCICVCVCILDCFEGWFWWFFVGSLRLGIIFGFFGVCVDMGVGVGIVFFCDFCGWGVGVVVGVFGIEWVIIDVVVDVDVGVLERIVFLIG